MTSTVLDQVTSPEREVGRARVPGIPFNRIVAVELRKMFDTRSGFWLLMAVAITSVLATGAVIIFAPDDAIVYATFGAAVAFPMSVLLPVIAIMSVTSEWSQRTGLTTFTLVPGRGRVVGAKLFAAVVVGIASMLLAMGVGAVGNLVGAAITGNDAVWEFGLAQLGFVVLAGVLGMLIGFMLGVVVRNTPGAVVGYFVYGFVVPTATGILAATQPWFAERQRWLDFQFNQTALYEASSLTGTEWAQLGVTTLAWLVLPTAFGLWRLSRAEVK